MTLPRYGTALHQRQQHGRKRNTLSHYFSASKKPRRTPATLTRHQLVRQAKVGDGEVKEGDVKEELRRIQVAVEFFCSDYVHKFEKAITKGSTGNQTSNKEKRTPTSNHKKRRSKLPKKAVSQLREWLLQHLDKPYPTELEKRMLAAKTGLTFKQTSNWFTNTRKRFVQPCKRQMAAQAAARSQTSQPVQRKLEFPPSPVPNLSQPSLDLHIQLEENSKENSEGSPIKHPSTGAYNSNEDSKSDNSTNSTNSTIANPFDSDDEEKDNTLSPDFTLSPRRKFYHPPPPPTKKRGRDLTHSHPSREAATRRINFSSKRFESPQPPSPSFSSPR